MGFFLVRSLLATLLSLSMAGLVLPTHFILIGPLVHSRVRSLHAGASSAADFFSSWSFGDYVRFCSVTSPGRVSSDSLPAGMALHEPLSSCSTPSRDAGMALDWRGRLPLHRLQKLRKGPW